MYNSRLNNNTKKRTLRNTILMLLGIILLSFVLFKYGSHMLIAFSVVTEKLSGTNDSDTTVSEAPAYIVPPTLDPVESATNSAKIIVSGYSQPKQVIKLYVNGELVGKEEVKKDKSFTFKNVPLEPGKNDIKARAVLENDKQSDYSESISITYVDKPPKLEVNSPSDSQSFSKDQSPLKISGKTDPGNKVTVNDSWAITDDEGKFTYTLPLQNGENKIKIEATDDAGNKTTKEIKVSFSQ